MVPASWPFLLTSFYPRGWDPFHCSFGVGHTSAPHWICVWASPNKRVAIEKQTHAKDKTKDLYSAYGPTGGCTYHLPFCLSLLPGGSCIRSYVCPSIYDYPCIAVAQHRKEGIQMTENPCYAAVTDYYNVVNVPWIAFVCVVWYMQHKFWYNLVIHIFRSTCRQFIILL